MTDSVSRLARLEEKIDGLVKGVDKLQHDIETFGVRVNQLELDVQESLWQLRERVAKLERDTAQLRLEIEQMRTYQSSKEQTRSERVWEMVMKVATPIIGGAVGWLIARLRLGE